MVDLPEPILVTSLDALDEGESIASILARFPEHATALEPVLETTTVLALLQREPTEAAKAVTRRALLNRAAALRDARRPTFGRLTQRWVIALATAFFLLLAGGGVVAAQSSLPGEFLYPLKRGVESMRLAVAEDPATVADALDEERRAEVAALLARGRRAAVSFEGTLERKGAGTWLVGGLPVRIDATTVFEGSLVEGQQIRVVGHTMGGRVVASRLKGEGDEPPAQPTTTPTSDAGQIAPAERGERPGVTSAPTQTARPSLTPLPAATPRVLAPPTPHAIHTNAPASPTGPAGNDGGRDPGSRPDNPGHATEPGPGDPGGSPGDPGGSPNNPGPSTEPGPGGPGGSPGGPGGSPNNPGPSTEPGPGDPGGSPGDPGGSPDGPGGSPNNPGPSTEPGPGDPGSSPGGPGGSPGDPGSSSNNPGPSTEPGPGDPGDPGSGDPGSGRAGPDAGGPGRP